MANEKLMKALEGADIADLKIDRLGRVVITNPAISDAIKGDLNIGGDLEDLAAGNGLCCGNGNCLSDKLVDMMNSFTNKR